MTEPRFKSITIDRNVGLKLKWWNLVKISVKTPKFSKCKAYIIWGKFMWGENSGFLFGFKFELTVLSCLLWRSCYLKTVFKMVFWSSRRWTMDKDKMEIDFD